MGLHESESKKRKKLERCRRRANVLLRVEGVGCIGDGSIPNHVGWGSSIRCNMNHYKKEREKTFFDSSCMMESRKLKKD